MQTAYMVVSGVLENYKVIRVYEVCEAAERYVLEYNNEVPWSNTDDKARVEEVEFVSVSTSARLATMSGAQR